MTSLQLSARVSLLWALQTPMTSIRGRKLFVYSQQLNTCKPLPLLECTSLSISCVNLLKCLCTVRSVLRPRFLCTSRQPEGASKILALWHSRIPAASPNLTHILRLRELRWTTPTTQHRRLRCRRIARKTRRYLSTSYIA